MKILLTHDGSAMADNVVPTVSALAAALGATTEITALVITSTHAGAGSVEVTDARDSLDRIDRALAPHPVTKLTRAGEPGPVIVETATALGIDLIAMSTAGTSGPKHFLGSVADYVVRHSHQVPVMLCRPMRADTKHFGRILLPLDGSPMNRNALTQVEQLAAATGASVVLLRTTDTAEQIRSIRTVAGYELGAALLDDAAVEHLITAELGQARQELADEASRLRQTGIADIVASVTPGEPGSTIVQTAEARLCDVIVMSPRGRGAAAGTQLLGSVADHVLQHVGEATVLIVPPDQP